MLALGRTTDRTVILVLALLLGVFLGIVRSAFNAAIIDVVPGGDRIRALNLSYWAYNLGSAAAAPFAGLLTRTEPMLLFAANAGALLCSALLLALQVPESRPVGTAVGLEAVSRAGIGVVFRDWTLMCFVVLTTLGWAMVETNKMLPASMVSAGLNVTSYGQVIAVNMVLIVAGQLFLPRLVARFRREHVLAASAALVGEGFGLAVAADSLRTHAGTVAVWTLGEMLMTPTNSALTVKLSPPGARGRYQGVFGLGVTGRCSSARHSAARSSGTWARTHCGAGCSASVSS